MSAGKAWRWSASEAMEVDAVGGDHEEVDAAAISNRRGLRANTRIMATSW